MEHHKFHSKENTKRGSDEQTVHSFDYSQKMMSNILLSYKSVAREPANDEMQQQEKFSKTSLNSSSTTNSSRSKNEDHS